MRTPCRVYRFGATEIGNARHRPGERLSSVGNWQVMAARRATFDLDRVSFFAECLDRIGLCLRLKAQLIQMVSIFSSSAALAMIDGHNESQSNWRRAASLHRARRH